MSESLDEATPLELDMLILQKKISQGDLESIDVFSEEILDRSRSSTERDHLIEARVRMERALLGMIDQNSVGTELRWCVDCLLYTSDAADDTP